MGKTHSKDEESDGAYTVNRVKRPGGGKVYSVAAVECESNVIRFFSVNQGGHFSVHRVTKAQLRKTRCRVQLEFAGTLESAWVLAVAVSPSCKCYAEGGLNNTVSLWDFASHRIVCSEQRVQGYISQISFITDNFIVYGSGDGHVYLSEILEHSGTYTLQPILKLSAGDNASDVMSVATHCMHDSNSVLCVFGGCDYVVYGLYLDSWLRQTETGSGELRRIEAGSVELGRDHFATTLGFGHLEADIDSVAICTENNARYVAICGDDSVLRVYQRGADTQIRNSAGDLLKHPTFDNMVAAVTTEIGFLRSCDWVSATRVVCVGDCQSPKKSANTAHILDLEEASVKHFGLAVELLTDGFMHGLAAVFVEFVANCILSFLPLEQRYWQLPLGSDSKGSILPCVSRCCQNGFVVSSWNGSLFICVPKHK